MKNHIVFLLFIMVIIIFSCSLIHTYKTNKPNSCQSFKKSIQSSTNEISSEKILELQLKYYWSNIRFLNTNLFFQMFFNLISILVMSRSIMGSKDVHIPVLDIAVPIQWLYTITPLALMFLWVQFGFLLNNIIEARQDNWDGFCHMKTAVRLFEDSWIVDSWFVLFEKKHFIPLKREFETFMKFVVFLFLVIICGTLLIATHINIFLTQYFGHKYRYNLENQFRLNSDIFIYLRIVVFFILILTTHLVFYFSDNENYFQSFLAVLLCVSVQRVVQ